MGIRVCEHLQAERLFTPTNTAAPTITPFAAEPSMSEILVPVSFGELLDKIAILQIKSERMTDPAKLANVRKELSALERTWMQHPAAGGGLPRCGRGGSRSTSRSSSSRCST